jgi:hypothetical protein
MFPRWKYSLFQSWFRRTLVFQKPLAFLSKIINCFTNIFDSKQLKYSPKVYIFALRRENGNSRRNEPLFLVSVDKLPCKMATECSPGDKDEEKLLPRLLRDHVKFPHPGTLRKCQISYFPPPSRGQTKSNPPGMPPPPRAKHWQVH